MPLITCSECKNPVASNAMACPHCGNPIKKKPKFSILRILFMVVALIALLLSLANGWVVGIVVSVVLLLLVAIAK